MDQPPVIPPLTPAEWQDLALAKSLLENPHFTMRLANLVGAPLERGFALLPQGWSGVVDRAARAAMLRALALAVRTLGSRKRPSREFLHKVLAGASGGIGGAFGLAALPFELPVSTAIMLRSIADIARSEGHDLAQAETKLGCLEVFALNGKRTGELKDSVYWVTRSALTSTVAEAATYLAQKGVVEPGAPVILRLVNEIASRFGVMVSEEVAATAIPILGAAGGGMVNVLFTAHFQSMARGHFIVKRLEASHGRERVREAYEQIPNNEGRKLKRAREA